MKKKNLIVVRGAGDLATGTIHRLKKAGFRLLVLEAEHPAAIRRQVALSEAVYAGSARVEDVEAVRMDVDLAEKKNRKELLEQEMERKRRLEAEKRHIEQEKKRWNTLRECFRHMMSMRERSIRRIMSQRVNY